MNTTPESGAPAREFKWGFGSAALAILALMLVGQFVGNLVEGLRTAPSPWTGREWLLGALLLGFTLSALTFLSVQRTAVARFFRTMNVGVALVGLSLVAVMVGVLVPQIDNFEDSSERVPSISDISDATFYAYLPLQDPQDSELSAAEREQAAVVEAPVLKDLSADQRTRLHKYRADYQTFRWAEGYFLYHLIHPYGWGMPKAAPLPPTALEGLERFGKKYGTEERDNRQKQMKAAFNGRAISQAIGTSIRAHESRFRAAFDVASALHLNRTYKSHWFATLLTLLFVGVGFNTFKGKPESWLSTRKVGYVTVHLGVMTLLIGGAISKLQTTRGIMHLDLTQPPTNEFWAFMDRHKLRWMPFSLKLERFARNDWKTLEVGFLDEEFKSNPPQYTLWPGRKIDLDFVPDEKGVDRPRIRLEVVSVHERAKALPSAFTEGGEVRDGYSIGPLATLSVTSGTTPANGPQTWQLSPIMRQRRVLYDPDWQFRVLADASEDLETAQRQLSEIDDGRIGWLSMRVAAEGGVEPTRVPIRVGDKVQAPGGYVVHVLRAVPGFKLDRQTVKEIVDERPIADQFPSNPAVVLEIEPAAGGPGEERPVLERLDYEEAGLQRGFRYSELAVNFEWDRWTAPGPERRVLHWSKDGRATLIAKGGSTVAAVVGQPLALPGKSTVVIESLLNNARLDRRIELDPAAPGVAGPHFDATFYSTDPTGVEVRVTTEPGTPEEKSEIVTLASTEEGFANEWLGPKRRFYLHYFENDKVFPFEWRSVLSVWKKDASGTLAQVDAGPESEREIRVNDYFHYRGYRFFQTNADPKYPTYSGIGVVYDPGIPYVLGGMYLTILGAILAFIVRPISEAYGKRKVAHGDLVKVV